MLDSPLLFVSVCFWQVPRFMQMATKMKSCINSETFYGRYSLYCGGGEVLRPDVQSMLLIQNWQQITELFPSIGFLHFLKVMTHNSMRWHSPFEFCTLGDLTRIKFGLSQDKTSVLFLHTAYWPTVSLLWIKIIIILKVFALSRHQMQHFSTMYKHERLLI